MSLSAPSRRALTAAIHTTTTTRSFASSSRLTLDYTHTLTVTSTRNNILLTFASPKGPVFPTITGGTDKTFKNAGRSTYEAAHQASLKAITRIVEKCQQTESNLESARIRIAFKGYAGQGTEAFQQALISPHGADLQRMITRVEDQTAVKIGGTRSRKPRRL